MNIKPYVVVGLSLSLFGCGGGGSGGSQQPSTPVSMITSIAPATATIGTITTFNVVGTNLADGMKFSLANCNGIVELAGGTSTQRQFNCTPTGNSGSYKGQIFANAGATTALYNSSVEFQNLLFNVSSDRGGYTAVVKPDGTLWAWGGPSGDGTGSVPVTPKKIGTGFHSVAVGGGFMIAIMKDGSLWSWGYNSNGVLGNGTLSSNLVPAQIGTGFSKVVVKGELTSRGYNVVALKADGTLWVWGSRSAVDPNIIAPTLSPTMIGSGFSDVVDGAQGGTLALKADGTLWSWQANQSYTAFEFQKVGDDYVMASSGFNVTYGLRRDGTLWNWGIFPINAPSNGPSDPKAPILIGSGFKYIDGGGTSYLMAIKQDGSLWGGGSNSEGQLGDGTNIGGAFKQVNAGFIGVWASSTCTFAQKSDGSLWAWGFCDFGDGKYGRYNNTPLQIQLP